MQLLSSCYRWEKVRWISVLNGYVVIIYVDLDVALDDFNKYIDEKTHSLLHNFMAKFNQIQTTLHCT